jgi:hypothetical protein
MAFRLERALGAKAVTGLYSRLRPVNAAQRLTALAFQIGRNSAVHDVIEVELKSRLQRLARVTRPLPVQFMPSPPAPVAIRPAASRPAASRAAQPQPRA